MARTLKEGLDYYPLECDFYRDRKVRKLIKYFGTKGVSIYTFLLCEIYRDKGYYITVDMDLVFDVADGLDIEQPDVFKVIKYCLDINLFDRRKYNKHNILSSFGIQKRYKEVKKRSTNAIHPDYEIKSEGKEKSIHPQSLEIQFPEEAKTHELISLETIQKTYSPEEEITEEEKQEEKHVKPIVNDLMSFFDLNETNNFRQMANFTVFVKELITEKRIETFKEQFEAYKEYKNTAIDEKAHSPQGFIEAWDTQNWVTKLIKLKKNATRKENIQSEDPNAKLKQQLRSGENATTSC